MPYEGESDRELVARVLSGATSAFNTLHRRYYARIYRLAYSQTNNRDDAEDIAAETFCRAFQRLSEFGFRSESLWPWLHRIAVNLSVDLARDRAAHPMMSLDQPLIEGMRSFLESLESFQPTPDELLQRAEVQEMVRASIASLVEDQRDAIVFRFLGDMTLLEIADEMQRTEGAVKALLHRGLIALRKEIDGRLSKAERIDGLRTEGTKDVRGDSIGIHRRIE